MRLYDRALSAADLTANFLAGPDTGFPPPVAQADSATINPLQKVRMDVLANDSGNISSGSVMGQTTPVFGTAISDANGKILYSHNSGSLSSDSFTYVVSGAGGTSEPATVTINFTSNLRVPSLPFNVPGSPPPTVYQIENAFGNLSFADPVCLASPPGETKRLFVCQKGGLLRMIPDVNAGTPTASTFLNLPALLASRNEAVSSGGEQGLLGIAFHPDFASNRHFYVFYSVDKMPGNLEPDNHPGPSQSDPAINAVIRYESSPGSGDFEAAYSIPIDNPYVTTAQGGSFGWNYREGNIARPGSGSPPAGFTSIDPIYGYAHGDSTFRGNSITGGFVYRGSRFSNLIGAYIFADLSDLSSNHGLLPYSVNLSFWSDHATKARFFTIPDDDAKMTWSREGPWSYPTGQIWVEHFDMPLFRSDPPRPGDPQTPSRRIETRLIVKTDTASYADRYRQWCLDLAIPHLRQPHHASGNLGQPTRLDPLGCPRQRGNAP